MASLDTNVVLRILSDDVPQQAAAALQLLSNTKERFAVADAVFIELEYALRVHYGLSRPEISTTLNGFAHYAKVNCNRTLLNKAFPLYEKHPALSFVDICLAVYAELNEAAPLWTFDKKLANQLEASQLVTI